MRKNINIYTFNQETYTISKQYGKYMKKHKIFLKKYDKIHEKIYKKVRIFHYMTYKT